MRGGAGNQVFASQFFYWYQDLDSLSALKNNNNNKTRLWHAYSPWLKVCYFFVIGFLLSSPLSIQLILNTLFPENSSGAQNTLLNKRTNSKSTFNKNDTFLMKDK